MNSRINQNNCKDAISNKKKYQWSLHTKASRFSPPKILSSFKIRTNQRVVFIERRVELLEVCIPRIDKQCSNFNANFLSLDDSRQRVRCAWALGTEARERQSFSFFLFIESLSLTSNLYHIQDYPFH